MNLSFKENFISTKEAGESSGYTPDYVARLIRSGKIVGQKIGHSWFVDRDSFNLFLADKHTQQRDTKISQIPVLESQTSFPVSPNTQKIREKKQEISATTNIPSSWVVVENGFFSHAFALGVALTVVGFGAFGAQAIASSHVADHVAAIAQQTAEGFTIAFGAFPEQIIAKTSAMAVAVAAITSAGVPSFSEYRNPIAFSSAEVARPHSFSIQHHPAAYEASTASPGAPHVTIRGTLAAASSLLVSTALTIGQGVTYLTHLAIGADVSFAYGVATVAPQSARAATLLAINMGAFLERGVARLPPLASGAYRNVTAAPAILAPALAQAFFEAEFVGIHHLVAFAENLPLSNVADFGRMTFFGFDRGLASVQVATERMFGSMPLAP
ncbi:MAG: helix-turn-helix domain-containing protein [Minisyncoccota bacterium]